MNFVINFYNIVNKFETNRQKSIKKGCNITTILKTFNTLESKTITDKIKYLFPSTLSYIFNILLIIISLSLSSLIFFRLVIFFNTQFTGSFPKIVIALMVIVLIAGIIILVKSLI